MEAFRTKVVTESLDSSVVACIKGMWQALKLPFYADVSGCALFPMENCEVMLGNDWEFNARAGRRKDNKLQPGFYFYAGMACAIYDAAHRVVSQPGFRGFKASKSVTRNRGVSKYAKSQSPPTRFVPARQVNDPGQLKLVEQLVRATTYFIAYHEICHFYMGHLHYKYDPGKPTQLAMGWTQEEIYLPASKSSSPKSTRNEIPPEKRVLMEFHADTIAVGFLTQHGPTRLGLGATAGEVTRNLVAGAAIALALIYEKCGMKSEGYPKVGTRLLSVLNGVLAKEESETKKSFEPEEAVVYLRAFLPECRTVGKALRFTPLSDRTIRQAFGGEPLTISTVDRILSLEVSLLLRRMVGLDDPFAKELEQLMLALPDFNKELVPYKALAAQLIQSS